MRSSVDRSAVLTGGLVGLAIGVGLLALALYFLLAGFDTPEEVLGVFLPLAVSLVSLGLAAMALVPLRFGDTPERSPRLIALTLRGLAGVGVVVTAAAMLRGELPWIAFALVPLLAAGSLVRDSVRIQSAA